MSRWIHHLGRSVDLTRKMIPKTANGPTMSNSTNNLVTIPIARVAALHTKKTMLRIWNLFVFSTDMVPPENSERPGRVLDSPDPKGCTPGDFWF
jgi:hypothetical protein